MPDREEVDAALAGIADPSGGGDVLQTGRAGGLRLKDGVAGLVLSVDGLAQDVAERLRAAVEVALRRVPRVTGVRIILTADRAAAPIGVAVAQDSAVPGIRRLVAVASGKGGVGKSTVAANLAVALAKRGLAVGLLDADIYGPSVPTLLGIAGRAQLEDGKLLPMAAHGIKALSIGMMMATDKAVIWRGPMAASAMMQMIEQANWGVLDVLVIDLPPGTGDIQLTMAQKLKPSGAVVVSTPQDLALIDARRAIAMFNEVKVPVLGIVENMSLFVCPHCGERSDIFGHGGAAALGEGLGVPLLGAVPLTMALRLASDAGRPGSAPEFAEIAERVATGLGL